MRERPILFSAPMVRAILDGRKTQTRRAVKDHRGLYAHLGDKTVHPAVASIVHVGGGEYQQRAKSDAVRQQYITTFPFHRLRCPHGEPGDRLWVRETHAPRADCWGRWAESVAYERSVFGPGELCYAADGGDQFIEKWRPSIHMPRWACRLVLEITDVRVERLQAISDVDAAGEGCSGGHGSVPGYGYSATPSEHFANLWRELYGDDSWVTNPWVWVISFKRAELPREPSR